MRNAQFTVVSTLLVLGVLFVIGQKREYTALDYHSRSCTLLAVLLAFLIWGYFLDFWFAIGDALIESSR